MWSVDPRWAPPPDPRHRPRRLAYVLAVVLPIVLVLAVAAPAAVVWGRQRLDDQSRAGSAPSSRSDRDGQPGVGDPYFPDYGSSGYDVAKYVISLDWDVTSQTMRSTTTITATATQDLDRFYYDLALKTDDVTVDGAPARFEQQGFQDVQVTPAEPIAKGSAFTVVVAYSGAPGSIARGDVAPWFTNNQEWTAAGEPESAAWWFPSNDHPSDPALMDVSIRVPAGMEAISVGRLVSADTGTEPDFDTWHWIASQPMATYVTFVSIGQYDLQQGVVDGRPYVYAVSEQLSAQERATAFAAMQKSGAVVRELEKLYGPYPFSELGGIVPAQALRFGGLEAQTRPVYERQSILNPDFSGGLVVHELAHMWFGDHVTLRQWNDIFTNEAYASWTQWVYTERAGGRSANDQLNRTYDRTKDDAGFWRVTMIDPGRANLFTTVYTRGPMVLQALRNVMGDKAFLAFSRDWAQTAGTRSLEEWMITAQAGTSVDLVPFFQEWIFGTAAPERTAANGFR